MSIVNDRGIAGRGVYWETRPYLETGSQLSGAHLGAFNVASPMRSASPDDSGAPAPFLVSGLGSKSLGSHFYEPERNRLALSPFLIPDDRVWSGGLDSVPVPVRGSLFTDISESSGLASQAYAYSHAGVGEKGPYSRAQAEELGTYKSHSQVDPLKAARKGAEEVSRSLGPGRERPSVLFAQVVGELGVRTSEFLKWVRQYNGEPGNEELRRRVSEFQGWMEQSHRELGNLNFGDQVLDDVRLKMMANLQERISELEPYVRESVGKPEEVSPGKETEKSGDFSSRLERSEARPAGEPVAKSASAFEAPTATERVAEESRAAEAKTVVEKAVKSTLGVEAESEDDNQASGLARSLSSSGLGEVKSLLGYGLAAAGILGAGYGLYHILSGRRGDAERKKRLMSGSSSASQAYAYSHAGVGEKGPYSRAQADALGTYKSHSVAAAARIAALGVAKRIYEGKLTASGYTRPVLTAEQEELYQRTLQSLPKYLKGAYARAIALDPRLVSIPVVFDPELAKKNIPGIFVSKTNSIENYRLVYPLGRKGDRLASIYDPRILPLKRLIERAGLDPNDETISRFIFTHEMGHAHRLLDIGKKEYHAEKNVFSGKAFEDIINTVWGKESEEIKTLSSNPYLRNIYGNILYRENPAEVYADKFAYEVLMSLAYSGDLPLASGTLLKKKIESAMDIIHQGGYDEAMEAFERSMRNPRTIAFHHSLLTGRMTGLIEPEETYVNRMAEWWKKKHGASTPIPGKVEAMWRRTSKRATGWAEIYAKLNSESPQSPSTFERLEEFRKLQEEQDRSFRERLEEQRKIHEERLASDPEYKREYEKAMSEWEARQEIERNRSERILQRIEEEAKAKEQTRIREQQAKEERQRQQEEEWRRQNEQWEKARKQKLDKLLKQRDEARERRRQRKLRESESVRAAEGSTGGVAGAGSAGGGTGVPPEAGGGIGGGGEPPTGSMWDSLFDWFDKNKKPVGYGLAALGVIGAAYGLYHVINQSEKRRDEARREAEDRIAQRWSATNNRAYSWDEANWVGNLGSGPGSPVEDDNYSNNPLMKGAMFLAGHWTLLHAASLFRRGWLQAAKLSEDEPTAGKIIAGLAHVSGSYPRLFISFGTGKAIRSLLGYAAGDQTLGQFVSSLPWVAKEAISYPVSQYLSHQLVRYPSVREGAAKLLTGMAEFYGSLGSDFGSAWASEKSASVKRGVSLLQSLSGKITGNIEQALGRDTLRSVSLPIQEIIDPVIDIASFYVMKGILVPVGRWIDRHMRKDDYSAQIAYSHAGVGEKGPHSRAQANALGTYKSHSVAAAARIAALGVAKRIYEGKLTRSDYAKPELTETQRRAYQQTLQSLPDYLQDVYEEAIALDPRLSTIPIHFDVEFLIAGIPGMFFGNFESPSDYKVVFPPGGSLASFTDPSQIPLRYFVGRAGFDPNDPEVLSKFIFAHEMGHAHRWLDVGNKIASSEMGVFSEDAFEDIRNRVWRRRAASKLRFRRSSVNPYLKLLYGNIIYRENPAEVYADAFAYETLMSMAYRGNITLTNKDLIERRIQKGLESVQSGDYGRVIRAFKKSLENPRSITSHYAFLTRNETDLVQMEKKILDSLGVYYRSSQWAVEYTGGIGKLAWNPLKSFLNLFKRKGGPGVVAAIPSDIRTGWALRKARVFSSYLVKHWGVGEKGPASRLLATLLGTFKEHSSLEPLRAAAYAATQMGWSGSQTAPEVSDEAFLSSLSGIINWRQRETIIENLNLLRNLPLVGRMYKHIITENPILAFVKISADTSRPPSFNAGSEYGTINILSMASGRNKDLLLRILRTQNKALGAVSDEEMIAAAMAHEFGHALDAYRTFGVNQSLSLRYLRGIKKALKVKADWTTPITESIRSAMMESRYAKSSLHRDLILSQLPTRARTSAVGGLEQFYSSRFLDTAKLTEARIDAWNRWMHTTQEDEQIANEYMFLMMYKLRGPGPEGSVMRRMFDMAQAGKLTPPIRMSGDERLARTLEKARRLRKESDRKLRKFFEAHKLNITPEGFVNIVSEGHLPPGAEEAASEAYDLYLKQNSERGFDSGMAPTAAKTVMADAEPNGMPSKGITWSSALLMPPSRERRRWSLGRFRSLTGASISPIARRVLGKGFLPHALDKARQLGRYVISHWGVGEKGWASRLWARILGTFKEHSSLEPLRAAVYALTQMGFNFQPAPEVSDEAFISSLSGIIDERQRDTIIENLNLLKDLNLVRSMYKHVILRSPTLAFVKISTDTSQSPRFDPNSEYGIVHLFSIVRGDVRDKLLKATKMQYKALGKLSDEETAAVVLAHEFGHALDAYKTFGVNRRVSLSNAMSMQVSKTERMYWTTPITESIRRAITGSRYAKSSLYRDLILSQLPTWEDQSAIDRLNTFRSAKFLDTTKLTEARIYAWNRWMHTTQEDEQIANEYMFRMWYKLRGPGPEGSVMRRMFDMAQAGKLTPPIRMSGDERLARTLEKARRLQRESDLRLRKYFEAQGLNTTPEEYIFLVKEGLLSAQAEEDAFKAYDLYLKQNFGPGPDPGMAPNAVKTVMANAEPNGMPSNGIIGSSAFLMPPSRERRRWSLGRFRSLTGASISPIARRVLGKGFIPHALDKARQLGRYVISHWGVGEKGWASRLWARILGTFKEHSSLEPLRAAAYALDRMGWSGSQTAPKISDEDFMHWLSGAVNEGQRDTIIKNLDILKDLPLLSRVYKHLISKYPILSYVDIGRFPIDEPGFEFQYYSLIMYLPHDRSEWPKYREFFDLIRAQHKFFGNLSDEEVVATAMAHEFGHALSALEHLKLDPNASYESFDSTLRNEFLRVSHKFAIENIIENTRIVTHFSRYANSPFAKDLILYEIPINRRNGLSFNLSNFVSKVSLWGLIDQDRLTKARMDAISLHVHPGGEEEQKANEFMSRTWYEMFGPGPEGSIMRRIFHMVQAGKLTPRARRSNEDVFNELARTAGGRRDKATERLEGFIKAMGYGVMTPDEYFNAYFGRYLERNPRQLSINLRAHNKLYETYLAKGEGFVFSPNEISRITGGVIPIPLMEKSESELRIEGYQRSNLNDVFSAYGEDEVRKIAEEIRGINRNSLEAGDQLKALSDKYGLEKVLVILNTLPSIPINMARTLPPLSLSSSRARRRWSLGRFRSLTGASISPIDRRVLGKGFIPHALDKARQLGRYVISHWGVGEKGWASRLWARILGTFKEHSTLEPLRAAAYALDRMGWSGSQTAPEVSDEDFMHWLSGSVNLRQHSTVTTNLIILKDLPLASRVYKHIIRKYPVLAFVDISAYPFSEPAFAPICDYGLIQLPHDRSAWAENRDVFDLMRSQHKSFGNLSDEELIAASMAHEFGHALSFIEYLKLDQTRTFRSIPQDELQRARVKFHKEHIIEGVRAITHFSRYANSSLARDLILHEIPIDMSGETPFNFSIAIGKFSRGNLIDKGRLTKARMSAMSSYVHPGGEEEQKANEFMSLIWYEIFGPGPEGSIMRRVFYRAQAGELTPPIRKSNDDMLNELARKVGGRRDKATKRLKGYIKAIGFEATLPRHYFAKYLDPEAADEDFSRNINAMGLESELYKAYLSKEPGYVFSQDEIDRIIGGEAVIPSKEEEKNPFEEKYEESKVDQLNMDETLSPLSLPPSHARRRWSPGRFRSLTRASISPIARRVLGKGFLPHALDKARQLGRYIISHWSVGEKGWASRLWARILGTFKEHSRVDALKAAMKSLEGGMGLTILASIAMAFAIASFIPPRSAFNYKTVNRMASPTVTRSSVQAFLFTDYSSDRDLRQVVRGWEEGEYGGDSDRWDNMSGALFHAIPIGGRNGVFTWGAKPETFYIHHYGPGAYMWPDMAKGMSEADKILCCYPNYLPKKYRVHAAYPKGTGPMVVLTFSSDRLESNLIDIENRTGWEPRNRDWIKIKLVPGYGAVDMANARWGAVDTETLDNFAEAHPIREYAITYGNYKRLPSWIRGYLEGGVGTDGPFDRESTAQYNIDHILKQFAQIQDPYHKRYYYLFPKNSPQARMGSDSLKSPAARLFSHLARGARYSLNKAREISHYIATSHWGVGEKGWASRLWARILGTFKEHSVTDPLKIVMRNFKMALRLGNSSIEKDLSEHVNTMNRITEQSQALVKPKRVKVKRPSKIKAWGAKMNARVASLEYHDYMLGMYRKKILPSLTQDSVNTGKSIEDAFAKYTGLSEEERIASYYRGLVDIPKDIPRSHIVADKKLSLLYRKAFHTYDGIVLSTEQIFDYAYEGIRAVNGKTTLYELELYDFFKKHYMYRSDPVSSRTEEEEIARKLSSLSASEQRAYLKYPKLIKGFLGKEDEYFIQSKLRDINPATSAHPEMIVHEDYLPDEFEQERYLDFVARLRYRPWAKTSIDTLTATFDVPGFSELERHFGKSLRNIEPTNLLVKKVEIKVSEEEVDKALLDAYKAMLPKDTEGNVLGDSSLTPHQNLETSGEMNTEEQRRKLRDYKDKSRVDPIKAAIDGEIRLAATRRDSEIMGVSLETLHKAVFERFNISENDLYYWLRNNTATRKVRGRGVNLQEVRTILTSFKRSGRSDMPAERRVFLSGTEKRAIIRNDTRQITSLASGPEYSGKMAFDNMIPRTPAIYGAVQPVSPPPDPHVEDHISVSSETAGDITSLVKNVQDIPQAKVKSHVSVKVTDAKADIAKIEKLILGRLLK